jgi:hypothetical protein
MKKIFILYMLLFAAQAAYTQQIPNKLVQAKWVKIMNADSVFNFFEAEAEFEKFNISYEKAKAKAERKRAKNNVANEQEAHLESIEELYINPYIIWRENIKPFVLESGAILSITARLAIINSVRNNKPIIDTTKQ